MSRPATFARVSALISLGEHAVEAYIDRFLEHDFGNPDTMTRASNEATLDAGYGRLLGVYPTTFGDLLIEESPFSGNINIYMDPEPGHELQLRQSTP